MRRKSWYLLVCLLASCSLSMGELPSSDGAMRASDEELCCTSSDGLPTQSEMAEWVTTNPIAFLEQCLTRYEREVCGYRARLIKQERVNGKLGPREVIRVCCREHPFSVRMEWDEGARLARKTLYVAGAYRNEIQVVPAGWRSFVGLVSCPVQDEDARTTSRYAINEFGLQCGSQRTLAAWRSGKERNDLHLTYQGIQTLPELGHRPCWLLERIEQPGSDPEGIVRARFYFDVETWLQVGTELEDGTGATIARYYFSDLEVNPRFAPETFTREGLRKR